MRLALNSILRAATKRLSDRVRATTWGQARRWFRMQGRLRSHEPTQILVCAAMGAMIGALIAGLHKLVDWGHVLAFNIAGGHSLSAGIGIDMERVLYVPVVGGLLLGLSALVMRYFGAREIVDPIEANALHGGRMSMRESLRLVFDTFLSNVSGVAVGMEAGYSQLGASVLSKVGQYFKLRRTDQRIFVAAGAAAAIAAAFNAPIAGAFYGARNLRQQPLKQRGPGTPFSARQAPSLKISAQNPMRESVEQRIEGGTRRRSKKNCDIRQRHPGAPQRARTSRGRRIP